MQGILYAFNKCKINDYSDKSQIFPYFRKKKHENTKSSLLFWDPKIDLVY